MNLCLEEIISSVKPAAEFQGEKFLLPREIQGISIDSRTVKNGDLFFAIKGDNFDGHNFVMDALNKGALAAVVTQQWFKDNGDVVKDKNVLLVSNTLITLQEVARHYRLKHSIPTLAITGSVGKTTAKEAVYAVLTKKYKVLRNNKSFNNHVGVPLTLLGLSNEHEILLTEIGMNAPREIDRLAYLAQPSHGMITSIAMAHLEFLGSLEGVAQAKMELFNHVPPSGTAFINRDDEILQAREFPVKHLVRFGLSKDSDVHGKVLGCDTRACYLLEVAGEKIQLQLPGKHNVYNALAAVAVGLEFGVSMQDIKEALEDFMPFEKRMQVHFLNNGVVVLDDSYNSNPTSCAAALNTLSDLKVPPGAMQYAVLGDMLELGKYSENEHRQLGRLVAELKLAGLFAYGAAMKTAIEEADKLDVPIVMHFGDKNDLLDSLLARIKSGDQILVKGSRAMHMEEITEGLLKKFGG